MRLRLSGWFWRATLAGSVLLTSGLAQAGHGHGRRPCCPHHASHQHLDPYAADPYATGPHAAAPEGEAPYPYREQPEAEQPLLDSQAQVSEDLQQAMIEPEQFAGLGGDMLSVNDSVTGYIDNPIVGTQVRIRADAAYDNFFPDRAEFFYGKCGCFRNPALPPGVFDPGATGPTTATFDPEQGVDYQDIATYIELAATPRFSVFTEVPVRFLNPVVNANTAGLADINAGFKFALYTDPCRYLTLQFRTYVPTGDADRGLGTQNVNLEPGLLYLRRWSDRWWWQGEVRHWVAVDGTDFAGNVIRYGLGLGYDLYRTCPDCFAGGLRITPITEAVGWTVLNGATTNTAFPAFTEDATGDTIVNIKVGTRATWGPRSLYAGYGHSLTNDHWYRDIIRLEYRRMF